jgi:hypothetical protein
MAHKITESVLWGLTQVRMGITECKLVAAFDIKFNKFRQTIWRIYVKSIYDLMQASFNYETIGGEN